MAYSRKRLFAAVLDISLGSGHHELSRVQGIPEPAAHEALVNLALRKLLVILVVSMFLTLMALPAPWQNCQTTCIQWLTSEKAVQSALDWVSQA